jgi:cyclase
MKRIIFVLLHRDGYFMLSRNFRLQRVGDIDWVLRNYEIQRVSQGIDELMILDVSTTGSERTRFHRDVERLVEECFIPVTVGGRLLSSDAVATCFSIGADKVLLNQAFFIAPGLCEEVAATYGSQALIAGVDVGDELVASEVDSGRRIVPQGSLADHVSAVTRLGAGEVLVQSVDRDGTGNGLDLRLAEAAAAGPVPLILMGGIGQASHISEGLSHDGVDAVATANLFNFIGNSLIDARDRARLDGVPLGRSSELGIEELREVLRDGSPATGALT